MWRLSISEIDSSVSSLRKNICRIASMFIITRAVSTPRDVERRERGSMFCETRCFSLDIRLFTYISSCSLSRSSWDTVKGTKSLILTTERYGKHPHPFPIASSPTLPHQPCQHLKTKDVICRLRAVSLTSKNSRELIIYL